MKSLTVWHGHSTRPSLPAGTARKASRSLPRGRRSRLIMPPSKEKQSVPDGERPAVHIAVICGFNRKFYKQSNSQRPVCDMQFTVVANESNRELRWQGASGSRVPIKQYLQKFPKWGRFGVTSVTPFLLRPVHPKGRTPAHRT